MSVNENVWVREKNREREMEWAREPDQILNKGANGGGSKQAIQLVTSEDGSNPRLSQHGRLHLLHDHRPHRAHAHERTPPTARAAVGQHAPVDSTLLLTARYS